jgi:hypothetical protein
MRHHGLPVRAARKPAMMQTLTDLPPVVVADVFGIHPGTVHRWAKFADSSWSDYLAAMRDTAPTARPGRIRRRFSEIRPRPTNQSLRSLQRCAAPR